MNDVILQQLGISRRDALKQLGALGLLSASVTGTQAQASASAKADNARIVIVGGGAGGICVAARLCRAIKNPKITIIEPNDKHIYQAGQTLVGGGIKKASQLIANEEDLIPSKAKWLKSSVKFIDPDAQKLELSDGTFIEYDYLVLSPGLQYDWNKIEGLSLDDLGHDGISSIWTLKGAEQTWKMINDFSTTGGESYFTHPNTPIKCGGAPKKIMYLADAHLRRQKTRQNATLTFCPDSKNMFALPEFDKAIFEQYDARDMKYNMGHNLVKIDRSKKEATYSYETQRQGEWDDILEEHEIIKEIKYDTRPYDLIHVTPPMSAPDFLVGSKLIYDKGSAGELKLINVDQYTLQCANYSNVFALGDAVGTPFGKTGGTVRKQAPVIVQNLLDVIDGKAPSARFDGYTVCPIITGYGTVMLAEFDYTGKPTPIIPLDPTQERWIWWMLKVYMLEPIYFYGMMKGIM
jgi:sulfide:quinone oxidoreductase